MRKQEESNHQQTLFNWAKYNYSRHPELQLLHSIPNGANVSNNHRMRLVAEGLTKGIPDLHLPVARGNYSSLYMELKTSSGKLRPAQKDMLKLLREYGNYCYVSRNIQESIAALEKYLKLESV